MNIKWRISQQIYFETYKTLNTSKISSMFIIFVFLGKSWSAYGLK